jgi:hypothetical protein
VARRPPEREWVYLDRGRRTTQLMRESLGRIAPLMSQFSDLLRKSAAEVRNYCATSSEAKKLGIDWLLTLAQRMDLASALESDADAEREIDALAYSITDSGPLTAQFAPSFQQALGASQRRRKKERRK